MGVDVELQIGRRHDLGRGKVGVHRPETGGGAPTISARIGTTLAVEAGHPPRRVSVRSLSKSALESENPSDFEVLAERGGPPRWGTRRSHGPGMTRGTASSGKISLSVIGWSIAILIRRDRGSGTEVPAAMGVTHRGKRYGWFQFTVELEKGTHAHKPVRTHGEGNFHPTTVPGSKIERQADYKLSLVYFQTQHESQEERRTGEAVYG